uniref:Band_3_cyto domain-containing protein n=1 Tax=Macrostomum lignano TaxID=282301 RepID=A0A1I8HEU0_9PLAT
MSESQPVPDSMRDCYSIERVCEEVSSHRCLPHGSPHKVMLIGVQMPSHGRRRHRRRRLKQGAADPSARVQFLLGNNEDEEADELDVHPVFCEMDELVKCDSAGDLQWRETARWIKFEEDVEEGGERWSKPHVATLSLFALFEVRNSIYSGEILLDCDALTMEAVADLIADRFVSAGRLSADTRPAVVDALLKRHLHLHERRARANLGAKIRSFADIGKKMSSKDLERGEG